MGALPFSIFKRQEVAKLGRSRRKALTRKLDPEHVNWAGAIISVLLTLGLAQQAETASFTLQMTPAWTFSPSNLEIQVGDMVAWVNQDTFDYHDSLSFHGYWYSDPLDYGVTYSLSFPVPGTFAYEDTFYGEAGMSGTIVVNPVTAAPPPVLMNPALQVTLGFQFAITNLVIGQTNIIQVSTDLVYWANIYTNVATSAGYTYIDTAPEASVGRFYRAFTLP